MAQDFKKHREDKSKHATVFPWMHFCAAYVKCGMSKANPHTHTGTVVLVSGYKDHTRRSEKKKTFNSTIHLRVKGMLGEVEG